MTMQSESRKEAKHVEDPDPDTVDYDIIIIGAGAAGCEIARKFTEGAPKIRILVLEAGLRHDNEAVIADPTRFMELYSDSKCLERFYFPPEESVPQKGLGGRSLPLMQNRIAGGGTSVFGMQYVRPSAAVLERWQYLTGDPDFGPDKAWPRMDSMIRRSSDGEGLLSIVKHPDQPDRVSVGVHRWTQALSKTLQLPIVANYNDRKTPVGAFESWDLYETAEGQRVTSLSAFLPDSFVDYDEDKRQGHVARLQIRFGCTVTRLLFDPLQISCRNATTTTESKTKAKDTTNAVCTGVEYTRDGVTHVARCRQMVVLTAGTHSPQLLLRSGIGPRADLQSAGVPVVVDSPQVGRGFTNHLLLMLEVSRNEPRALPTQSEMQKLALYAGGAFLPDPLTKSGPSSSRRAFELIGMETKDKFQWMVSPVQSRSAVAGEGSMRILPNQSFAMDLAYLANADDLRALRLVVRQVAATARYLQETMLVPDGATLKDDRKLDDFIRANIQQAHHWACGCRIGRSKQVAVCAPNGRVFDTENVVVADASACPSVPDGNTSASALLMASIVAYKWLKTIIEEIDVWIRVM